MARQVFTHRQEVMIAHWEGWRPATVTHPDIHSAGWREPHYVEVEVPPPSYERAPRRHRILNNRRLILSLKEYEPVRLANEAEAARKRAESAKAQARVRARFMAHAYQVLKFDASKLHAQEDVADYLEEHFLLQQEPPTPVEHEKRREAARAIGSTPVAVRTSE